MTAVPWVTWQATPDASQLVAPCCGELVPNDYAGHVQAHNHECLL